MDLNYFMKIQNAYKTQNARERNLYKINNQMSKHFEDTFDTEDVLLNGKPFKLMIIKDTDGNTYKKKIKSPHDHKFNIGDYVTWNNQTWLITLLDSDDKTWNRGYMYQCTILLRWQNERGEIIERYGYSEDFTKYSTGTTGNSTMTLGDYQYGITLPVDEETKIMKRDKRFPIDFEGIDPPDVYKLTNRKILLTDNQSFGRGGILTWTLSYSEFNPDTDKKITLSNGTQAWICDYNSSISEIYQDNISISPKTSFKISHKGSSSIVAGGNSKKFYVTDLDGNLLDTPYVAWNVTTLPGQEEYISYEISDDNSIKIKSVYDVSVIGSEILLTASISGVKESLCIEIGGGI